MDGTFTINEDYKKEVKQLGAKAQFVQDKTGRKSIRLSYQDNLILECIITSKSRTNHQINLVAKFRGTVISNQGSKSKSKPLQVMAQARQWAIKRMMELLGDFMQKVKAARMRKEHEVFVIGRGMGKTARIANMFQK